MGRARASFGVVIGALALCAGLGLRASTAFGLPAVMEQAVLPWAGVALALAAVLSAWLARPTKDAWLEWGLLPLAGVVGLGLCVWSALDLARVPYLLPPGLEAAGGFALVVSALRFFFAQAERAVEPTKLGERRKVRLVREGQKKRPEVPVASLVAGDIVEVKTGADIPVDGEVMQGSGFVDESALFGSILPAAKKPSDSVFAGTHSTIPELVLRARRPLTDSLIAQRETRLARTRDEIATARRATRVVAGLGIGIALLVGAAPYLNPPWASWPTLLQVWAGVVLSVGVAAPALAAARARLAAAGWARAHGVVLSRARDLDVLMAVRRWQIDPLLLAAPGEVEVLAFDDTPKASLLAVADALFSESYGPEHISLRAALEAENLERLDPAAIKREDGVLRGTVNGRRWFLGAEGALEGDVELAPDMKAPLGFLRDKGLMVLLVGRDDAGVLGAVGVGVGAAEDAAKVARALDATVMPGLPDAVRGALADAANISADGPPLTKHDATLLTPHAELPSSGARLRVVEPTSELRLPEQAAPRVFRPALARLATALEVMPTLRREARRRGAIALLLPAAIAAPLSWLVILSPSLGTLLGLFAIVYAGRGYREPAPVESTETGSAVVATHDDADDDG